MRITRICLGLPALVLLCLLIISCGNSQVASPSASSDPVPDAVTYSSSLVANKVWLIKDSESGSSNIYLIEGDRKALLIDTGLGSGKLARYVQSLTQLPVTVVCTHGHGDHVGGNYQFDDIYGHAADFPFTRHAVQDGYQFDLGGRSLEVIEVPGHSPGSIGLLDVGNRILFTGDNPNQFSWDFLPDSAPVEGYLQSLRKLERRTSEYDTVLPGHGGSIDSAIISEQAACAQSILDGSCAATPYSHYLATASTMVCTWKRATIAYNSTRLWLNK